jgi:hypothetical protein
MDSGARKRHHFGMPASPRCAAFLRDGSPCGRTVAAGSEFCVHHAKLLETVDAETMKNGKTPKPRARKESALRLVSESPIEDAEVEAMPVTNADPATVRPLLAAAAAENVQQLKTSLLEAAGSAVKPVWITVECDSCGERSRIEAPVPDVRARVAAIELLLREGLGRPATADDVPAARMPVNVAAIKAMSWEEMQTVFAATYADELAVAVRDGGAALLRQKLAALSDGERRVLRNALAEAV